MHTTMHTPYPLRSFRLRLTPGRRLRRRLRLAAGALCFALGAAACAAFGGESGRLQPNLELPTLGGSQFWTDVAWDADWKVQQHTWTGHGRLLDPRGVRRAWGAVDACTARLGEVAHLDHDAAEPTRPFVVLLHGLGRSHRSLGALERRLENEGYEVLAFEYASTRGTIEVHAKALAELLAGLPEPREVSFVTHSLGGVVLRELTRDPEAEWRSRHRLGRAVTLAAPHGGAAIAARTARCTPLAWILGPAYRALADGSAAALPAPDLEFATIAGARGDGGGWNPWVPGDDDGLVALDEARLDGASDHLVLRVAHTFILSDPRALDAVCAFLRVGDSTAALDIE